MGSRDLDSLLGFHEDPYATRFEVAKSSASQKILEVVPPTTRANFLSFAKVNVYSFFSMCVFLFVYSMILASLKKYPYDGLNLSDFDISGGHIVVLVVIGVLVLARFASAFWRTTFLQKLEMALLIELTLAILIGVWWGWGTPILVVSVIACLANIWQFQLHWYSHMQEEVKQIVKKAPEKPESKGKDQTNLSNLPTLREVTDMLGMTDDKDKKKDEEKAGNFEKRKHTHDNSAIKHKKVLENAYVQACDASESKTGPIYTTDVGKLYPVQETWFKYTMILFDMVNSLSWFLSCILLGLWTGESMDRLAWTASAGACVTITVAFGIAFLYYMCRTFSLLGKTRGILVAEKEWLTYDMAKSSEHRTGLMDSVMDQSAHEEDDGGKNNLVYCWKCAFDVYRRTGCGFLALVCHNFAYTSKDMFEKTTEFDYKKFMGAFWDITIDGIIAQAFAMLALITSTIMYFSSDIFIKEPVPQGVVLCIALVCVGSGAWKSYDLWKLFESIKDKDSDNGHRPTIVGESIILVVAMFLLTIIAFIVFILPMMSDSKENAVEPYIGDCHHETFHDLLPGPCRNKTIYYD